VVDLVEEGIDVAIRVAQALDGRYVARPLAKVHLAMFAAPEYLRRHGRPRRPEDLAAHRTLVFTEPRPMDELLFVRGRQQVRVKLRPVMSSNHGNALCTAAAHAVGLALVPSALAQRDLQAGRIERVLLDWALPEFRVFAVYPHRRFLSPKVRALLEALRASFGDGSSDPWWPEQQSAAPTKPPARRMRRR
jgi:DNA-binding transcriptional LysR family regulator